MEALSRQDLSSFLFLHNSLSSFHVDNHLEHHGYPQGKTVKGCVPIFPFSRWHIAYTTYTEDLFMISKALLCDQNPCNYNKEIIHLLLFSDFNLIPTKSSFNNIFTIQVNIFTTITVFHLKWLWTFVFGCYLIKLKITVLFISEYLVFPINILC